MAETATDEISIKTDTLYSKSGKVKFIIISHYSGTKTIIDKLSEMIDRDGNNANSAM